MLYRLSQMFTVPFTVKRASVKVFNTVSRLKSDGGVTASSSLSYCIGLVKKFDHENYLCTLLLPDHLKATAFAIRAFNIELSRVQELVTEPKIMPVRFQFWEDRLNDIYEDKVVDHPVVIELSNAVKRHKLSKIFLKRLLIIRAKQCSKTTFKDLNEMEIYANQTNSPVYMLLLEASGLKNVDCDHAASHLGTAQGITNLIRSLPFNLKERLVLLPTTLLVKYNMSEESMFRREADQTALNNMVYEVASMAWSNLKIVQSLRDKIPADHRAIFLPAVAVTEYLKNLEKGCFDVFAYKVYRRNGLLPIWLYWNKIKKTF